MEKKINDLCRLARKIMQKSNDPMHDLTHVKTVVHTVRQLSHALLATSTARDALILSAWWHDVSRTKTKNPSILWMPLVDDLWSAFCLMRAGRRRDATTLPSYRLATRLILCKSLGTGAILTRILLKKSERSLVNILKDADLLDLFSAERARKCMAIAEKNWLYKTAYRLVLRSLLSSRLLEMRTEVARVRAENLLSEIIAWAKEDCIKDWHFKKFGEDWFNQSITKCEKLLRRIEIKNRGSVMPS